MALESSEIAATASPGQFLMVRVREGTDPLLRRPFSICATKKDGLFLILYRVVGHGTSIMAEAVKGDKLSVLGPLGKGFEVPQSGETPILVSGGIGLAPIIFLAQVIGKKDAQLMTGFRTSEEIMDMKTCGLSGFQVSVSTDDGTTGHPGFVTDQLEHYLNRHEESNLTVCACGPDPMLEKVAALTLGRGVPCQISLETHMACGVGACQGCAVLAASGEDRPYLHVCEDGPVFPAESLTWNTRHGSPVP